MWKTVKLGDICTATQGVQILKSKQNESETFGYRRYLYISDFKHDKNLKYVEDVHPKKLVTADDIIVSNTGSQGEVYKGIEGILSNNLFKVTFDKELVDSGFLFMFLKSSLFVDFQNERTRGSTQPHMGHKNFLATPFSYPPLAEQQRIVAKLDAAFAEIDKATRFSLTQIGNIDALQQQLLNGWIESNATSEDYYSVQSCIDNKWINPPFDGNHGEIHPKAKDYTISGVPFIMARDLVDGGVEWAVMNKLERDHAMIR